MCNARLSSHTARHFCLLKQFRYISLQTLRTVNTSFTDYDGNTVSAECMSTDVF